MRKLISVVVCCMLFLLAVHAEIKISATTIKMLRDASVAEGKEYLAQRDAIIKRASTGKAGKELMAELKEVAKDKSQPWEIRLMSSICIERIEHGDEINELIHYKWRTHPEYNKEWDKYLGGPLGDLAPIIVKELKKKKLWFYYLENTWKETKEYYDYSIVNNIPSLWRVFYCRILTDSPESYYLFRILEETVRNDSSLSKDQTYYNFKHLIKNDKQLKFSFFLDIWGQCEGKKLGLLRNVLALAKPEDMDYIRKFGKTTKMKSDERAEFERQVKLLNKKFGLTADAKPAPKSTEIR